MARKRSRKARPFNLRKVRINTRVALGALVADSLVAGGITNSSTNPYRIMSVELSYSIVDLGATADDGQTFGLAHGDYTAAEIEACLEASGAIDVGDMIARETSNRLVRELGSMQGAPGTGAGRSHNNGQPVKTKLNWGMSLGDTIRVWCRNNSGNDWTTGASIAVDGFMWIKDSV